MTVWLSALRVARPLPTLELISVRGSVDRRVIVQLQELGHLENAVTRTGMESATFWIVA